MTDLSTLSDAQLQAMYSAPPVSPVDLSSMSDADLMKAYGQQPNIGEDVAKSAGIGLVKGGIGMAGAAGDIGSIAGAVTDYAGNALGAAPDKVQQFKDMMKLATRATPLGALQGMGSSDIQKAAETVTGDFYKPKTVYGEFAQTGAEFLPAMIGGGEGLATKLLTRVAAPAVASETAGQLTKGTAAEPYARVGGALLGGVGGYAAGRAMAPGAPAAPTVAELKAAARSQYQDPEVLAVQVKPQAVSNLRDTIKTDLEAGTNAGFRAANEPKTFRAVDELINPNQSSAIAAGAPMGINDLDSVRKVLNRIAKERTQIGEMTSEALAASRAIGHIDDFILNLKQPDLLAGNAAKVSPILQDARANWAAAQRAKEVGTKLGDAQLQAQSTYGGGNINNAIRQQFRPLLKNDARKAVAYSAEELAQLNKIVKGTTTGNVARVAGKWLGPNSLTTLPHLGAAYATGGASIPASLAIGALGSVAKGIGNASTKRSVTALSEMIRSRSPLARGAGQPPAPAGLMPLPVPPPIPSMAPSQPVYTPPAPRMAPPIMPQQAPPIFAQPKPVLPPAPQAVPPQATVAEQPTRLNRAGMLENERGKKYQDWVPGKTVRVGFVDGLKVEGSMAPQYKGDPRPFILTKGDTVYRAVPHRGLEKLSGAEAQKAIQAARNNKS